MTQFQDPFYHLMKSLFLDCNIVSAKLNLMDDRYKETQNKLDQQGDGKIRLRFQLFFSPSYELHHSFLLLN